MEAGIPEAKYHKLATEYAKVRAQAGVLKKAVLEEQSKSSNLREQLRQRETALRRSEQEVDSLGFRNKQLEHRVAVLQEEIALCEGRVTRQDKNAFNSSSKQRSNKVVDNTIASTTSLTGSSDESKQNALIFEELQKKIMENAHLTSLIDDKERDLQLHGERINDLEQNLEKRVSEHSDLEKRLRRELETIQNRNAELETKLVEAASMLGSEDALSVSGSELTTPPCAILTTTSTVTSNAMGPINHEERLAWLEREVSHWRAQYEILQLTEHKTSNNNHEKEKALQDISCSCSTSAAGITVQRSLVEHKNEIPTIPTNEQIIYNRFSEKYEELLHQKCTAESHLASYVTESEHLQNCLENATCELKAKDEQIQSINRALQVLEEDLATTRINYDEQISVLTEQVVSLTEQLAACY